MKLPNLQEYFLQFLQTPIQKCILEDGVEIYIKREDLSFASFGTKIRKFHGLLKYARNFNYTGVILRGNPHANFLPCFSFLFKLFGFQVFTIAHLHYHTKDTPNSILSRKFSDAFFVVDTPEEDQKISSRLQSGESKLFELPLYGVHPATISGLKSLWDDVKNYDTKFERIFVDIGSGLTILSAIKNISNIPITGVCIGVRQENMVSWLEGIAKTCELSKESIQKIELIPPTISPGFSRVNSSLITFIQETYQKSQLPLEPVYSGKSLYTIVQYLKENPIKGKALYIHQGGLLNHVSIFSQIR